MDHVLNDGGETSKKLNPVHYIAEDSRKISVNESASETVIVIIVDEEHGDDDSGHRANKDSNELNNDEFAIDVKCGSNLDGERVCRICHLSSDIPVEANVAIDGIGLIQLGCDCKAELGIAHPHCAEVWFKIKGNRLCEICGETAKNITGNGDDERFLEEWNENGSGGNNYLPERSDGCCRRQPLCNILLGCLVIAFVLPWLFRVNMF